MKKKLRLHRETLRRLNPSLMSRIAGGETGITCFCNSDFMAGCQSDQVTECPLQTVNTNATQNCTGENCTDVNTHCLCPVC